MILALGRRAGVGLLTLLGLADFAARGADRDWPAYLGDAGSTHYSTLKRIHARNVHRLQVAWTYRSGDARHDNLSQIQCNPVVIDGVLYGTTPGLKLVAVDAASGLERWRFDPFAGRTNISTLGVNRGVIYWCEGDDRRILFTADHYLYAIDAVDGKPVLSFGTEGRVDLKDGLDYMMERATPVIDLTPPEEAAVAALLAALRQAAAGDSLTVEGIAGVGTAYREAAAVFPEERRTGKNTCVCVACELAKELLGA